MSELQQILKLAADQGLQLFKEMRVSDMGLDFRIVFATDLNQKPWVLRIPRRAGMDAQIHKEKQILSLVRKHLSVQIPDWQIAHPTLVAYPLLQDPPVLSYDAMTYEVTWYMDPDNPAYLQSLAKLMLEIHQIPIEEAKQIGLDYYTELSARTLMLNKLKTVESAMPIPPALYKRWSQWIDTDDLWPKQTCFIHGDLFAGHIMAPKTGPVSGVIDWSEAHVNDPSIDFAGHLLVFGEDSLRQLLQHYTALGGEVWPKAFEQTKERAAASALNYAFFALEKEDETLIDAARVQMEAAGQAAE